MNLKDEIITFVNQNENEGALLITGEWGCGKTYFINSLIQETQVENLSDNPCNYVFALISLYGIDSIDSLHKEVKKAVCEVQSISNEKDNTILGKLKALQPVTEAFKESSKIVNAMNVALQINPWDFYEIKPNVVCYGTNVKKVNKRLVLIFDDLERCKLDISDLLGAINYYVETKKIKTIVVANEDKINNKEDYLEFKEKTILRTLYFSLDIESTLTCFISNYKETPANNCFIRTVREVLTIPKLCRVFRQSSCNNYRILKRALINAERFFNILNNYDNSLLNDSTFYKYALYQFIAVFMEYQISNFTLSQLSQFNRLDTPPCFKYNEFTFSFLSQLMQNCIYRGIWDSDSDMTSEAIVKIKDYQLFFEHRLKAYDFFKDNCSSNTLLPSAIFLAENNALDHDELFVLLQNIYERKNINQMFGNIDYSKVLQSLDNGDITAHYYNSTTICNKDIDNAMNNVEPSAKPILEKLKSKTRF